MATTTKKKKPAAKKAVRAIKTAAKASNQSAWTQQSAKLLPFTQGDAAASVQSATENLMRMGSDAMQQWFGAAQSANPQAFAEEAKAKVNDLFRNASANFKMPAMPGMGDFKMPAMPGFDASEAQEKIASFARESAEQLNKSAGNAGRAMNEAMSLSRENAEALVEVSNIAVAVSKELGAELINYANKSFATNVDLSKQVLACRTLNDMFDLSSKFMKSNLDGFFSESVKLSELLFQCATDVSEPLNERITQSSDRISKALAA